MFCTVPKPVFQVDICDRRSPDERVLHHRMIGLILNSGEIRDIRFTELNPADWMSVCLTHFAPSPNRIQFSGHNLETYLKIATEMAMDNYPYAPKNYSYTNPLVNRMPRQVAQTIRDSELFNRDFFVDYNHYDNVVEFTTTDLIRF